MLKWSTSGGRNAIWSTVSFYFQTSLSHACSSGLLPVVEMLSIVQFLLFSDIAQSRMLKWSTSGSRNAIWNTGSRCQYSWQRGKHTNHICSSSRYVNKARIFLIVDLQDFFLKSGVEKKRYENDQLTVNQQSILNLYIFHHFPKNLDRTNTFNSATFKSTQTEPQKYIIFFN